MRPSELFLFGQTIVLLVVISWGKAGLLSPWGEWFIATVVLTGVIGVLLLRSSEGGSFVFPWKPLAPFALFVCLVVTSLFNPTHHRPDEISFDLEAFEEAARHEPALVPLVGDEFSDIQALARTDPGRAIALFYRFRMDFQQKFGLVDSRFGSFIERYEKNLKLGHSRWLPSCVTADATTWKKCYPVALLALQAVMLWHFLKSRRLIRRLLLTIVVNGLLLAVAGTLQKLSYDPGDNIKEIWGLWDAPEPRYYFASFTYKNHWSAFSLLCLGVATGLAWREIHRKGSMAWRKSMLPCCVTAAVLIAITIPLSGSRSGTFFLVIFLICLAFASGWSATGGFSRPLKRLVAFGGAVFACILVASSILWFGAGLHRETKSEAIGNTLQQWESLQKGSMPMRYYLWKDTWTMFLDKPVFGHGLGSFRALHPLYQSQEYKKQREFGLEYAHRRLKPLTEHSHNDWFQYLAETGIVGVTLLVIVPALGMWQHRRLWRTPMIWSLLGCLLLATYSFVDFPSRTPACLVLFVTTFALTLKYAALDAKIGYSRKRRGGMKRKVV